MRHLPEALKDHIDKALGGEGSQTLPLNLMLSAAHACIGVTEVGHDKGPMVELFQETIVAKPWGEAWCVDFLQALIAYAELTTGIQSILPATESVLSLWRQAPDACKVSSPEIGDVVCWEFGTTGNGHCGIITGIEVVKAVVHNATILDTIEGNTTPSAGIQRTGDGVYAKRHLKGGSETFRELGFLRVFNP